MGEFVPWNSQPLNEWAAQYAHGKFADLNGRQTHYIEMGQGEPLILVHGFLYDANLWSENINALAEHFKVFALDLWGFGYSTREPLDYGYPLYSDQILKFMDHLGLERASIMGQSMGGGVVIHFSVFHTSRLDKLLLVAPAGLPASNPPIAKPFDLPQVGEFLLGLPTYAIRKMIFSLLLIHDNELLTESYLEKVTWHHKIKGSTEAMLSILRKKFFFTLNDEIHRLGDANVPTLIVWGKEDRSLPWSLGQRLLRILSGSQLEMIDDAGHVPNYEHPNMFNHLAINFLKA